MDIKDLEKVVTEFIDSRDWRQFQTTKELALSASIESNELLQLFEWLDGKKIDERIKSGKDEELFEKIRNETSDVLFACLAIAEHLNFNLGEAFLSKIKELDERYPVDTVKGRVVKIPSKK